MFSDVKLGLRNALLLALLMYFSFLMLEITLQYIPIDLDVAFLRIKHDVIGLTHYQIAFFTHVFTSMFALLAGFTQFSFFLRKKYPLVHRGIGKLYVVVILLLSGPSGLIMGYYANGGWSSQWAFMLLAMAASPVSSRSMGPPMPITRRAPLTAPGSGMAITPAPGVLVPRE